MVTRYVSERSPASMEFAFLVLDICDKGPDGAELDMMHFLYGVGQ
jgi:hypothetical protein